MKDEPAPGRDAAPFGQPRTGGETSPGSSPGPMVVEPLVTIIIPSYNHGPYVQAAIKSAIAQDYQNIELIVIDDGSSDDSPMRIRALGEKCHARFSRYEARTRSNRGLCETLNEGIAWAGGDYLAILDSDDILMPHKTSRLLSVLQADDSLVGVFGGCTLINEAGLGVGEFVPKERTYGFGEILSREKAFISSCMLVRMADVRKAGGYKPGLYIEDWYMWLKLTEGGASLMVLPEPLVKYRQHGTNISKNGRKMFSARLEILNEYAGHPQVPKALSSIWIQLAADLTRTSKLEALRCAYRSCRAFPAMSTYRFFWTTILKALTPGTLLDALSSWKRSVRAKVSEARSDV